MGSARPSLAWHGGGICGAHEAKVVDDLIAGDGDGEIFSATSSRYPEWVNC
jgi:hypothetical protein